MAAKEDTFLLKVAVGCRKSRMRLPDDITQWLAHQCICNTTSVLSQACGRQSVKHYMGQNIHSEQHQLHQCVFKCSRTAHIFTEFPCLRKNLMLSLVTFKEWCHRQRCSLRHLKAFHTSKPYMLALTLPVHLSPLCRSHFLSCSGGLLL